MSTFLPRTALACALLSGLVLSRTGYAQSPAPVAVDMKYAWFKPSLTHNDDPVCEQVLKGATSYFESPARRIFNKDTAPFPNLTRMDIEAWTPGESVIPSRDGPLHIRFDRHPGCGGGCETYALQLSDRPFPEGGKVVDTDYAPEWALYADSAGGYFALAQPSTGTLSSEHSPLVAYRLTRTEKWKSSCRVKMSPTEEQLPPAVRQVRDEDVLPFRQALHRLMGDAGRCGSMAAHAHRVAYVTDAAFQILFRPWALLDRDDGSGVYREDVSNLALWSLGGLGEYETLTAYRWHYDGSRLALASFYTAQFALPPAEATRLAAIALEATESTGIHFSEYSPPFNDEALRRALLTRSPLREIQQIPIDARLEDDISVDSVLNVAITYPEALRYLLDKGFNPSKPNAFGKTPLMYAAQRNEVGALKLLLERGADVDASTVAAPDTCYFTLETRGMTALHYAARYASAEAIRVLVQHGASTFAEATGTNSGTPLEWLRKYTTPDAKERNPNITAENVSAAEQDLQLPSPAERRKRVETLRAQARAAYAARNYEAAYRMARTALKADGPLGTSLNDFALIALRAGHIEESLSASETASRSTEIAVKAAGYFNMGLACEQVKKTLYYDDRVFCLTTATDLFLRSWLAQPTAARAEKLNQMFQSEAVQTCVVGTARGAPRRAHLVRNAAGDDGKLISTRVLIQHRATQPLDPADVEWSRSPNNKGFAPLKATHVLGTNAISVFESTEESLHLDAIEGEPCPSGR